MEPPNYKSVITMSQQSTPETDSSRKGEGSLKHKTMRPRSRTGSGGILRVDINKPNLTPTELGQDPPSPQPSVDRLSVSFAPEERSVCSSDASVKINVFVPGTPPISCMEKVRFPTITDGEDSDEDYSASVTAIIQRRESTRKSRRKSRKKGRRTSSPFCPDIDGLQVRRRSSVFTTSSGETAISMEDSLAPDVTQEQIFENIRLHKEVLSNVKMHPWAMRRKLKLVQQAKTYIKSHRGVLQERLAHSGSTRDILARWNIYLVQKLQRFRRELANLSNLLIPWERRIKQIESHFGSVVASYFTFLRWLFWVNFIISIVLIAFVAIPELLTADPDAAGERKVILDEEKAKSTNLYTLWDFEGILKYSPLFYGYYTNRDVKDKGYRLPFAYFMTGLGVYVYSFVATLQKMAKNSRMSKLSEKDDECVFSWKLFTGWDYMIGNAETAQNRVSSIILGFKEALLEEAEKKRETRNWKIISVRVAVNFSVLALLAISAYAVVEVVQRSTDEYSQSSFWRRNETTIVMSLITYLFPMLFEILGFFEHYHPRKQLRLQLARIMVLNILNLYSLIFSLFDRIGGMTKELQKMKNETIYLDTVEVTTDATTPYSTENQTCFEVFVNCSQVSNLTAASLVLSNLTIAYLLSNLNQTQNTSSRLSRNATNLNKYNNYSDNFTLPKILENQLDSLNKKETIETSETTTGNLNQTTDYYEDDGEYFNFDYGSLYKTEQTSTSDNPKDSELTTKYNESNETSEYYEDDGEYFNFDYSSLEKPTIDVSTTDSSIVESTSNSQITSDYYEYENETEYYEDSDEYFNFDYSTLDLLKNVSTTKNMIAQTVITTLLDTVAAENDSETITVTWNTDELLSTILNTYNFSTENDTFNFTSDPQDNFTDYDNYTTNFSTNITEILTDIYERITTEAYPICTISQCNPVITKTPNINPEKGVTRRYNYTARKALRNLCWETMFGQELVKLTVMDLSFTMISILAIDFIRAIFVRVMNNCWCWDLEKKFPQYGDFKIAENILHLVNNQGMVWMGMFFSPGIIVINLIKLAIMMYLRSWAVLTCNVPHEVVFKASKSNNFYLALLLTMLFLCVLPVGFAIVWIEPSWHCGPFSNYSRIYHIFTKSLKNALPKALHKFLDYIASPFIVIPLLVLLILIIYYLISLTNALREANDDLKFQLRRERTEERKKMFQIVDRRKRQGSGDSDNTPFGKWKKLLPILPNSKSFDGSTSGKENDNVDDKHDKVRDFVKSLKKASKKHPEVMSPAADDATDTEQHESLPEDINTRDVKSEKNKKAINTFKKLLNAKKQHREAEAAKKVAELQSTISSSIENIKIDTKSKKSDKPNHKNRSISRSSSSKELRQDSITSNWSDNIPVIKIIGTGSSECILEHQNENSSPMGSQNNSLTRKTPKIVHQDHVEVDMKSDYVPISEQQIAEPQKPVPTSSSTETLITVKVEDLETDENKDKTEVSHDEGQLRKEFSSVHADQAVGNLNDSVTTIASSQTVTESSTEYQEY